MPTAAAIATQLTDRAVRPFGLYLGGLDVIRSTIVESIEITEAEPGSVSSMRFTILDAGGTIPLPASGSEVAMHDLALDTRIFAGYLNDYTAVPMAGSTGRTIAIEAIGIECILDWEALPATVLPGTDADPVPLTADINYLANTIAPTSALTAPIPTSGDPTNGDATRPIGYIHATQQPTIFSGYSTPAGSLRAAIEYTTKTAWFGTFSLVQSYADVVVTVDFLRRLRVYNRSGKPDDYTDLTISDTVGGALASTVLDYEVHPGDVCRAVYIVGGNADGTGWETDGTGIVGRKEVLNAADSTNATRRAQIGALYLASRSTEVRGTLTIENYSPSVGTVHPGSSITITDANVSLSAQTYKIARITKRFYGNGKQDWTVEFGTPQPSFIASARRELTSDPEWKTRTSSASGR